MTFALQAFWQKAPGFARRRLEGLLFAACLLVLTPLLGIVLACRSCSQAIPRDDRFSEALRRLTRRWGSFVAHGLGELRRIWWVELSLESALNVWRYVLLLELVELRNLMVGRPPAGRDRSSKILVVAPGHLGDLIHTVPMLRLLRRHRPSAKITLFVGPWCSDLAARIPYVDEVAVHAPHLRQFYRKDCAACLAFHRELAFACGLRRRDAGLVITAIPTNLPLLLLVQGARPDTWIGVEPGVSAYGGAGEEHFDAYETRSYEPARIAGLLRHAGIEGEDVSLEFWVNDDDRRRAADLLARHGVGQDQNPIAVAPGAGFAGKVWPAERFAELVDWLVHRCQAPVVLLGANEERALGEIIAGRSESRVRSLIGETSLFIAGAVLEQCRLFVGNDNGLLHVAAALGVPTVSIFGPTWPEKWAPRGRHDLHLRSADLCGGCYPWHTSFRCSDVARCMKAVSVEQVQATVESLLAGIPALRREPGS